MEFAFLRKLVRIGALGLGLFVYTQIISVLCLTIYLILLRDNPTSNVEPAFFPLILLILLGILGIAFSTLHIKKKYTIDNKWAIGIAIIFLLITLYSIYVGFYFEGSAWFFYRGLYELNPTLPPPSYISGAFWWNWWPR